MYVSYEIGSEGRYTESEMRGLYESEVDHDEYGTFEDWKIDMLKSGVFEQEEKKMKTKRLSIREWNGWYAVEYLSRSIGMTVLLTQDKEYAERELLKLEGMTRRNLKSYLTKPSEKRDK